MSRFQDLILQGIRADQPLATDVAVGTLYGVMDEDDILERSDGSAWLNYGPALGNSGISAGSYGSALVTFSAAGIATAALQNYLQYQDQQTQNTSGGTFTSGAWRTRVLNTEVTDVGGFGSLSSNQVTLAAGTYLVSACAPAFVVNRHQLRLQNVTDTATLVTGQSCHCAAASNVESIAELRGIFTVAASKALELQHQCETTGTTRGFGVEANFTTEVYAIIQFWKIG